MFFKSKFLKGVKFLGISKLPIFSGAAISACERNMEWQRGIFLLEMMMDVKCELDVSNSVDWKKLLLCWSYKLFWKNCRTVFVRSFFVGSWSCGCFILFRGFFKGILCGSERWSELHPMIGYCTQCQSAKLRDGEVRDLMGSGSRKSVPHRTSFG